MLQQREALAKFTCLALAIPERLIFDKFSALQQMLS